jgi:hypothetical protein
MAIFVNDLAYELASLFKGLWRLNQWVIFTRQSGSHASFLAIFRRPNLLFGNRQTLKKDFLVKISKPRLLILVARPTLLARLKNGLGLFWLGPLFRFFGPRDLQGDFWIFRQKTKKPFDPRINP